MDTITNGAAQTWRACKRKYLYRYVRALRPQGAPKSHALRFGSLYHRGLEAMFNGAPMEEVGAAMAALCPSDTEESAEAYGIARAMLTGYRRRWHGEDAELVDRRPEVTFMTPIRNPAPRGRVSKAFRFEGKIDLVGEHRGELVIMEHKTASRLDGTYLAALWTDTQITGYCYAIGARRVIYDVAVKPSIRRGTEESLDDYLRRIEELYVGGYSAGRTRRRKDESDEGYWTRRKAEGEPVDMYHREHLIIGDRQIAEWQADLWDTCQEIILAKRHGRFPRSTARCYDWGRACEYAPICQSLGNEEAIISMEYETAEAHPELLPDAEEALF